MHKDCVYYYLVCPPLDALLQTPGNTVNDMPNGVLGKKIPLLTQSLQKLLGVAGGREYSCCSLLCKTSHTCSIGDKSGDRAGQSIVKMPELCRTALTALAVCGLALSCWRVSPNSSQVGIMIGVITRSRYLSAFSVPSMCISSVFPSCQTPPYTITPPTPWRSCSVIQQSL